MSAFTVTKRHIDVLVAAMHAKKITTMSAVKLGAMLWGENYASVNARYRTEYKAPPYKFEIPLAKHMEPVCVLKQVRCYSYQSCEHDGWETSKAFAFCEVLEAKLGVTTDAKGYDAAPWGI